MVQFIAVLVVLLFVFTFFFSSTNSIAEFQSYDISINDNWSFLRKLGREGWSVSIAEDLKTNCKPEKVAYVEENTAECSSNVKDDGEYAKCLKSALEVDGCYVAWIGGFNKGKTTLLNRVSNKQFPTGYDLDGETRGLNFILPEFSISSDIVHIDTPGDMRSVSPEDLQDRYMTDRFVYDLIPDIADTIILVVDILTSDEQVMIGQLMETISTFSINHRNKKLFIIHNFKSLTKVEDVEKHIQTDIFMAFNAVIVKSKEYLLYKSEFSNNKAMYAMHFVYAAEKSPAGVYYNVKTIELLKELTKGLMCSSRSLNILDHLIDKLTPLLRDYFWSGEISEDSLLKKAQPVFSIWNLLARGKLWIKEKIFNIESPRVEMVNYIDDLSLDPYKLHFEAIDDKDGIDGMIKLKIPRDLVYCSTMNIGDKPECRPNPRCAVWQTSNRFTIQCRLSQAQMSTNEKFSKDIETKFIMYPDADNNALVLCGTILPIWENEVLDEEKDSFELLFSDGHMHGWVSRTFSAHTKVFMCWDKRNTTMVNGVFTLSVPLNCMKT